MMLPSQPHVYTYSGDEDHRVLRCPWHGYEFRLSDGTSITDPKRIVPVKATIKIGAKFSHTIPPYAIQVIVMDTK